jgi:hypothetical protein
VPKKVPHHPLQGRYQYSAQMEGRLPILVGKWLI